MDLSQVKQEIASLLNVEGVDSVEAASYVVVPQDTTLGDYALPCFRFAKALRKPPVVIAQDLANALNAKEHPFKKIEAVNGYLNFTLDRNAEAGKILGEVVRLGAEYGASKEGEGKTVCIDYSSINIAKPFHIGHLSSTVIGGALYKMYKKLGYNTIGINHLGDWGTQFGKLIVAYKLWGDTIDLQKDGLVALTSIYVKFHEEAEKDPTLDDQARYWFKQIEDGNEEALKLFYMFKELTLKEVQKVYERLGIEFDSYNGEAFYNDKMAPVLKELGDQNLITVSDGAQVVDLGEYNMPPCLLVRTDGATLYATRDLAAAFYRKNTYDFFKCLYVVAYQQNLHFKQVFKVVELMGKEWHKDLVHVPFGMVSLEDGTMSTRKGKVVWLKDVLDKAVEKSYTIINEKNSALKNKEEVADKVGVGAVIFFALSNNRIKDITFSYDKVLTFDGETGPYVQYTNARARSIIRKAGAIANELDKPFTSEELEFLSGKEGEELVSLIGRFNSTISDAVSKYEPSILTRYIIDVAKSFNRYYLNNRILNAEEKAIRPRLALVYATHVVIEEGLRLLGIRAPEEM